MSEVTASSPVSASYASTPSDTGIAAAAKLVVDGAAVMFEQRVLANRATCSAALWRRRLTELRAMYVAKPE
jgi:hypothetical protein